jgi:hypothetical protein
MSYSGLQDMVAELAAGKFWSQDFFKSSGAATHVAGNAYDLSLFGGFPAANTYPGTALNSVAPDDTTGWGMPHGGNVTADTKHVLNALAMAVGSNSAPGFLRLVDVALYYPGVDLRSTALQTMTQAASLTRHTNGRGLRAFVAVTTQSGGTPASTPVLSVFNYRDQDDNDSALTGVGTINFTAGAASIPPVGKIAHCAPAANHTGPFLPLNAADTGIKRVNSFQLSTAYTGSTTTTGAIVLCKPLLSVPLPGVGIPAERSFFAPTPILPAIPDGACLAWLYIPGAAVAANSVFSGNLDFGWG